MSLKYGSKPRAILCTGGLDAIRKEAWPFYRTIFVVHLCWELEKPKGPKGRIQASLASSAGDSWDVLGVRTRLSLSHTHTLPRTHTHTHTHSQTAPSAPRARGAEGGNVCCIRICSAMVGVPHRPLLPSLPTFASGFAGAGTAM